MIAALLCAVAAVALVIVNGAEGNWLALVLCALGLWLTESGGERWLKRRAARQAHARREES